MDEASERVAVVKAGDGSRWLPLPAGLRGTAPRGGGVSVAPSPRDANPSVATTRKEMSNPDGGRRTETARPRPHLASEKRTLNWAYRPE